MLTTERFSGTVELTLALCSPRSPILITKIRCFLWHVGTMRGVLTCTPLQACRASRGRTTTTVRASAAAPSGRRAGSLTAQSSSARTARLGFLKVVLLGGARCDTRRNRTDYQVLCSQASLGSCHGLALVPAGADLWARAVVPGDGEPPLPCIYDLFKPKTLPI